MEQRELQQLQHTDVNMSFILSISFFNIKFQQLKPKKVMI